MEEYQDNITLDSKFDIDSSFDYLTEILNDRSNQESMESDYDS